MRKNMISRLTKSVFSSAPPRLQKWMLNRFIYRKTIERKKISPGQTPLFDTVFFEVRTRCNGHCKFCLASVGTDPRNDISMSYELFDKVLIDLADLGFEGRIAFHNNSEPLLFKQLPDFVARAKECLPRCYIQILTNGRALTLSRTEQLLKAGVDQISVNVYRRNERESVPRVLHDIRSKLLEPAFEENQLEVLGLGREQSPDKPKFSFVVSQRLENELLDSRAGTAPNKPQPAPLERGFCQYPFTQFIVSADGQVAGCCNDVLFELPMGNMKNSTVSEIWFGKEFSKLRGDLLAGDRSGVRTCRQCDFIGVKKAPGSVISKLVFAGLRDRG